MPSNVIRSFTYDFATRELSILFKSGQRYIYQDVPAEVFERLSASTSKGEFFNTYVREHFTFVRAPHESI